MPDLRGRVALVTGGIGLASVFALAAVVLTGDEASYVTGQVLGVDGGMVR